MWKYLVPLGVLIALLIVFAIGLNRDPRIVPSPLIGKPAPQFSLPQLHAPEKMFSQQELKGQVSLLNVWASWCRECRVEHPFLLKLARSGDIPIYGLNYKDERGDALTWLSRLGDPYDAIAVDRNGRVGIDWGVYGVPETFVVDRQGIIRWKVIGPVTPEVWQEEVKPVIDKLEAGGV